MSKKTKKLMRIYLDKQIFSHLYKQQKSEYITLLKKLQNYKNNGLFCYSHAHLLDLKNDKTDIKYKELDFIETLVDDNYLSHHQIDKLTSCYLAKPNEAFADEDIEKEKIDFSKIFDFDDSSMNDEQKEKFSIAKKLLTDLKFDVSFLKQNEIPKDLAETLSKFLLNDIKPMSIVEMAENFTEFIKALQNDKSVYKGLRSVSEKYINNRKFTVEYDNIDFNADLKNSVLQKTFVEFVNGNINPSGDKKISRYDFYINAYFSLDLLGISKESSKTVKFTNVLNDGFHSYYGAYCDIVVSDDNGFLKKTKVLYKLLGIDTKVQHVDEFIKSFSYKIDNEENNSTDFFSLLMNDLKNSLITESKSSLLYNRKTITIKSLHNYLGFFNRIDKMAEDGINYIYLYRQIKNYSTFIFFREYQIVINNAVRIFGTDLKLKNEFDWKKETKEIKDNKWEGRFWDFENITILIEINKGTNEFGLLITAKQ